MNLTEKQIEWMAEEFLLNDPYVKDHRDEFESLLNKNTAVVICYASVGRLATALCRKEGFRVSMPTEMETMKVAEKIIEYIRKKLGSSSPAKPAV